MENYAKAVEDWMLEIQERSPANGWTQSYKPSELAMETLIKYDWFRALYTWKLVCRHYGLTIQTLSWLTGKDEITIRKEMKEHFKYMWENACTQGEDRVLYTPTKPLEHFYKSQDSYFFRQVWCSTTQLPVFEVYVTTAMCPSAYEQRNTDVYSYKLERFNKYRLQVLPFSQIAVNKTFEDYKFSCLPKTLRSTERKNWKTCLEGMTELDKRVWRTPIQTHHWEQLKKAVAFYA